PDASRSRSRQTRRAVTKCAITRITAITNSRWTRLPKALKAKPTAPIQIRNTMMARISRMGMVDAPRFPERQDNVPAIGERRLAAADEGHLGGHDGQELHVRFERQAGHEDHRLGHVLHVHARLGADAAVGLL